MCWPVDRPATHAAAGAAARGALIFCFGGFFHTLRSGWHERVRGGGFNPLRGATTGVVMRRRATSGEMARGGLVFVFSLEVAPVSEGDSFTRSGETAPRPAAGQARRFLVWGIFSHARSLGTTQRGGALLLFVLRAVAGACVGRWTGQPRMPPRERQHEGLGGLGDSFTRSGVVRHACRPAAGQARRFLV